MRLWNLHCKCMQHVMTLCVSANYVNCYCGAMRNEGCFLQNEVFAVVQHCSDPVEYFLLSCESPRTVDCSHNGLRLPWPEAN